MSSRSLSLRRFLPLLATAFLSVLFADPSRAEPEMEVVEVAFPVTAVFPGEGKVRRVTVGDVVELGVRVPRLEKRSILWELTRFHIRIAGTDHPEPYYTYRDLYRGESKEMVIRLLDEMVERVRESGRDFGHVEALTPQITKGRYRGRTPAEVLVSVTRRDLQTFFQFVINFPGKYYGQDWDVDEIFATWVINEAPPSLQEVVAEALAAGSIDDAAAIVSRHVVDGTDVALERLPNRLRSDAEDVAREGDIARASRTPGSTAATSSSAAASCRT